MVEAVVAGYVQAPITPAERALLDYAVKLTRQPWACAEADIIRLREAGWSDGAILDLNLVAGYFNFVNRLASGLGVPLEERWNRPR